MKIYTLIAGTNGTGKSSLCGVLNCERNDLGFIIDVDRITVEHGFSPTQASRFANKKIDECLTKDFSFTQETTLVGKKTENTVKSAKEKGYFIRLYYIGLNSLNESLKRIKNRVEKGGHYIDKDTVTARYEKRFAILERILPFCDEIMFFDNENGFVKVAEYRNGELTTIGAYYPDWLGEFRTELNRVIKRLS